MLLKNSGVLPLRKDLGTIAVVGPTADDLVTLLGNYHGTPSHPVTILAGIRNAVSPKTQGALRARRRPRGGTPGPARRRRRSTRPTCARRAARRSAASRGEYFRGKDFAGEPVLTRVDAKRGLPLGPRRADGRGRGARRARRVARARRRQLLRALDRECWCRPPPASTSSRSRPTTARGCFVDGQKVLEDVERHERRAGGERRSVKLEAGKEHELSSSTTRTSATPRCGSAGSCREPARLSRRRWRRRAAADVVVFVGGLTAEVEGEEMRVDYPGFAGGDRTDIELPAVQRKLLEALHATGKPVVLVLTTGSALGLRWAQENAARDRGRLVPGPARRRRGRRRAVRRRRAPRAGCRSPSTSRSTELPAFSDYAMEGRTYRYFRGKPVYAFGHGLSYTRFAYSGLRLSRPRVGASDTLEVTLDVKNTGARAATRWCSSTCARPAATPRAEPLAARVRAGRAQGRRERSRAFHSSCPSATSRATTRRARRWRSAPGEFELEIGASSADLRLRGRFAVDAAAAPG